ncbi:MAG: alanine--tRNA ligase [Candidatus Limnocylindria bacterium]
MQPLTAAEVRERFQRFFEERGHTRVPSAPLLARDDPTLLFVNSGMVPFKRVLTGEETRPYRRAVDSQVCLRVAGKHNDFEEVGRTPRHQTLFEMLGSWSFGDYFKADAIRWHWQLLTEELGIPPDRLAATVYNDDDEAHDLWRTAIRLPEERIVRWGNIAAGDEKNFWSMGATGPCGPCSEIHYDRGIELSEGPHCIPDHAETCPRWLEVGNLVFMQFDRAVDGTLTPLPMKSVDTGTGLERLTSVLQGVDSNYRTDLFVPIVDRLAQLIGHRPDEVEAERFSYQVVADHSRATTFLLADGVEPSNEGAGYVLRRIMRRAIRHGRLMGIDRPFLGETCAVVIEIMGDAYPAVRERRDAVLATVEAEEGKFERTLEAGSERLAVLVERAGAGGVISGDEAFRLHDTFGFPIDLTIEIAAERGVEVDREGFERAMAGQRDRSRATRAVGVATLDVGDLRTAFIGYPNETLAHALEVLLVDDRDGTSSVVLDRTPFYPEGGGQVGDRGEVRGERGTLIVEDTQRAGEAIVHVGRLEGELAPGERVDAAVDEEVRWGAARNHTGTHLLHRALRDVLGEQAKQAGSYVSPDALRFDFPASGPTPREQLRAAERIVNAHVRRDAPVLATEMPLAEAQALGADMFFGEKYVPESVRVVRVDGYSKELCGGTHVASTGQIGAFVILGESSIGAGTRRIEAVTGEAADELIARRLDALRRAAQVLGDREENVPARVEALQARIRTLEREAREGPAGGSAPGAGVDVAALLAGAQKAGTVTVVVERLRELDASGLRRVVDDLRGRAGRFVAVMGGARGGPSIVVAASRDLVAEGFDASTVVRFAGPIIGGGGGGRPEMAQAGGRDVERLDDAIREAARLSVERLAELEAAGR